MTALINSTQTRADVSNAIWKTISPAVPDCLVNLGGGVYQATWWKPVPPMDLEIITRTDGIEMLCEPYEPDNLPGGMTVRFWVNHR